MLLLDANVCIDALRGRADVVTRLAAHGPPKLCLCSMVEAELAYGARLAADPVRAGDLVDAFCALARPDGHVVARRLTLAASP